MIKVQNLTKYYGETLAVNNVSFEVEKGTVVGFLGPNGAGKTTTVRIITCYLAPTAGTVFVDEHNIETASLEVRKKIGYLPENAPLYLDMTAIDYIRFMQDMRADGPARNGKRIKEVIEICGLETVVNRRIAELSKGFRQRVGLAQTLVHDPEILIFDEPTVGLDPNQIVEIRNLIKELGKVKTIILCSHILPEVEATCNRVLIISEGEIVADGTPSELQSSFEGKGRIRLQVKNNTDAFIEKIGQVPGVEKVITSSLVTEDLLDLDVETVKDIDPREDIFRLCTENQSVLMEMRREETSLEDIFRELTSREE
ncbi:MAG: ATP-binding cassette domain-containing protein [Candidatus Zixiibacteriota bacterium]|nr:MAG: ATP-binding cassette domain-containing protein [candidate division Zixibacteria bacterium]